MEKLKQLAWKGLVGSSIYHKCALCLIDALVHAERALERDYFMTGSCFSRWHLHFINVLLSSPGSFRVWDRRRYSSKETENRRRRDNQVTRCTDVTMQFRKDAPSWIVPF